MGIGSNEVESTPVAPAQQAPVAAETESNDTPSEASRIEAALTAKITALEEKYKTLVSSLENGLHNRVTEVEKTILRKFPYG